MKLKNSNDAIEVLTKLHQVFPNHRTELKFSNPFELLIATILSAQCTDERVNAVTHTLFKELKTARDFVRIDTATLESMIRPTGFYKNKARAIKACSLVLVERFNGEIPHRIEDLVTLPGVGRKTANLVLAQAFNTPAIAVDTHVRRVAQRLKLTDHEDPDKIELDLNQLIPQDRWIEAGGMLILHGRYICQAKKPRCDECVINNLCEWEDKMTGSGIK